MGRNINGGTDRIAWEMTQTAGTLGAVAFRFKTTQTTSNAAMLTYWNASSRNGWGIILNSTANKIRAEGYDATTQRIGLNSTTTINDGNEHSFAFNFNCNSGGSNQIYIDGAQEASGNSSASWINATSGRVVYVGDPLDTFWATYVGDIFEVAIWFGRQLTADEIIAYHRGFSAKLIAPDQQVQYAPLVNDWRNVRMVNPANTAITGTTVIPHCRVIGGSV